MLVAFTALTLLAGGRKGIWPVKKWEDGGGGHWLVRMESRPAGWSVCLSIFPCTIKSRSSLLAPAHPGGPGKVAIMWWWYLFCELEANMTANDLDLLGSHYHVMQVLFQSR